jgi:hypothetical protein
MTRVFGGLWCRNRDAVALFGSESEEGKFSTFTGAQVQTLASKLVHGLEQATASDVVTYYVVAPHVRGSRLITSGAVYAADKRLVVIVSNCRSEPHDARDFGFSPDIDTPDYPLLPINLGEQFRVGFSPAEAVEPDATLPEPIIRQMHPYRRPLDGKKFVAIDLHRLSAEGNQPTK